MLGTPQMRTLRWWMVCAPSGPVKMEYRATRSDRPPIVAREHIFAVEVSFHWTFSRYPDAVVILPDSAIIAGGPSLRARQHEHAVKRRFDGGQKPLHGPHSVAVVQ